MTAGALTYRPQLDGLRCVAISFVLIEHFGGYLGTFVAGGYYGVDLFFVISGYLITAILLKAQHPSFAASYRVFLGRRALRIFPAYYALLFLLLLLDFGPVRESFPWLATYTFNYPAALWETEGRDNQLFYLWSLSVEEQFYLLWPPLVLALRNRRNCLLGVTAAIIAVGYAQATHSIVHALTPFNYTGLINRMGSLGLGASGAIYVSHRLLP